MKNCEMSTDSHLAVICIEKKLCDHTCNVLSILLMACTVQQRNFPNPIHNFRTLVSKINYTL